MRNKKLFSASKADTRFTYSKSRIADIKRNVGLYILLIPGLFFIGLFEFTPMYGSIIAFKDFNIFDGILGSPWVGMKNFNKLFHSEEFYKVFSNTLIISLLKIVILFPIPIFVAVILNEVKNMIFKRTVQTIIYLPHFLSWIIVSGLFINILSPSTGVVNSIIRSLGGKPVSFMMDNDWFRSVLVVSAGWKEAGWNTIVFMAAISSIDQELYEAAVVDGAGRIRQMISITIPCILSTIVLILIMKLGHILEAGTQQILAMYNPAVYDSADVIGTYVYRMGLGKMDYSFSTAVGLFESVAGFILVITGNFVSKKLVQKSIW